MKIHAIQTGITRIKTEFQRGNADRSLLAAFVATFPDKPAIDLPIYAWLIEHDEGLFVIDTGDSANTHMTPVAEMIITPEQELGAQLAARGVRPKDITKVILTHLHSDHLGGVAAFREVPIYVSEYDHTVLTNPIRRRISAMANPIPAWLRSTPVMLSNGAVGAFPRSGKITQRGDVIAVPTPGHTAGHQSILINDGDVDVFIAGDVTYSENALIKRLLQGLSFAKAEHLPTIDRVLQQVRQRPTVYLPSHDWESAVRLEKRQVTRVP